MERRRVVKGQVQDVSPNAALVSPVDWTGTEITVVWGEELFQPVQYNTFRSGGNSMKVVVQPGETCEQAYKRGWDELERLGELQFADKLKGYAERLNRAKRI